MTPVTLGHQPADDHPIFHLALPEHWAAAFHEGTYEMSTRDRTLAEEGFIHCSTHGQLEVTANRFYADLDHLVVLTIDPALVPVVYEAPAPGAAELFPHVYGPLPVAAVAHAASWTRRPRSPWAFDAAPGDA
jgi:glutathione S-transferase